MPFPLVDGIALTAEQVRAIRRLRGVAASVQRVAPGLAADRGWRPSERSRNHGVVMAGGTQNGDLFPVFPRKMAV